MDYNPQLTKRAIYTYIYIIIYRYIVYVEGTKARAQTLASLLYSLSANPGFF